MSELAPTLSAWLLTFLVHSSLLLGAVALFERLRPGARPALRELLWRSALLGAVVTASLQSAGVRPLLAAPRLQFGRDAASAPVAEAAPASALPALSSATVSEPALPALAAKEEPAHAAEAPSAASRLGAELAARWPIFVALLWLAGATLALLRLAALAYAARLELRRRGPAGDELRAEVEALAGGRRAPALSVAPALAGPVALPGGEIVLPAWAAGTIGSRQRRAILAHELAHQIRRDPWWIAALLVLQALLWPQPLLGVARRRLARIAELEADAWAAASLGDARAVAECLADCAERMLARRAPIFGAAMADRDSTPGTLVHRIDRLLEGDSMPSPKLSPFARLAAAAAVLSTAFLLPGCDAHELRAEVGGSSIHVSVDDDDMTLSVSRAGYRLKMHAEGTVTFLDDESDVASIAAGGKLWIKEKANGVERAYTVVPAAAHAALAAFERTYEVDGDARPLDDEGRAWIADVLPRVFRETGYDAEARVKRLLRRGGTGLVLAEVEQMKSDWARGIYLGALFAAGPLAPADLDRAVAAMETVESDYEMRQMLEKAIASQEIGGETFARLLRGAARGMDSDYEMSELLVGALRRLPDSAEARTAWVEGAATLESDYELGRALGEAFDRRTGDAGFAAGLVALAARELESDYELRQALERAGKRIEEPEVAAAMLAATQRLESSYERSQALIAIADAAPLDSAMLASFLESTAAIEGDYERLGTLQAVAGKVAGDSALAGRYRELARDLGEYERGQALAALDDAAR